MVFLARVHRLNRPGVQEALHVRDNKFNWGLFATRLNYQKVGGDVLICARPG
jgi:hypothetical protein